MTRTGAELKVRDLSVTFPSSKAGGDAVHALDHMSLDVGSGEFVSIVGPSGCGKSTFLNAVAGLLKVGTTKQVRLEGSILLDGEELTGLDRRIAYMFQGETLLPWRTALENVLLPMRFAGKEPAVAQERARDLLSTVGLASFADSYPKELSGGMRKRVQLAQVLAQDANIIFMDEPFGSLDAQTKTFMQLEFLKLWEESGVSVIFVTHDLNEALLMSDRIVTMSRRPGREKSDYQVDIPRPRSIKELASEPSYPSLLKELWSDIEEESSSAMGGQ